MGTIRSRGRFAGKGWQALCVVGAVGVRAAAAMALDEPPPGRSENASPPAQELAARDPVPRDAAAPLPDRPGERAPTRPWAVAPLERSIVPLERAAPPGRLGSGTRGGGSDPLPRIEALVPDGGGFTLEAQPTLYWYASRTSRARIDLRVVALDPIETVRETTLPRPRRTGIQRIRLADHGIELAPGRAYLWLVILVPDPADRSFDRIAGGGIERVEPSPELERRIAAADRDRRAAVLADAGLWYDAIHALSSEIEARPGDERPRSLRASLLAREGLESLAADGPAAGRLASREP
jgi:hypothetical protein